MIITDHFHKTSSQYIITKHHHKSLSQIIFTKHHRNTSSQNMTTKHYHKTSSQSIFTKHHHNTSSQNMSCQARAQRFHKKLIDRPKKAHCVEAARSCQMLSRVITKQHHETVLIQCLNAMVGITRSKVIRFLSGTRLREERERERERVRE